MQVAVRTMYPWGGVIPPTPAPTGGGNDRLPPGRDRINAEMMVIAMWAAGEITEEEMIALLAGL